MTTDHAVTLAPQRRPFLVWVICGWYTFTLCIAVPGVIAACTGIVSLSGSTKAFYERFGLLDYLGAIVGFLLMIAVVVTLFRSVLLWAAHDGTGLQHIDCWIDSEHWSAVVCLAPS